MKLHMFFLHLRSCANRAASEVAKVAIEKSRQFSLGHSCERRASGQFMASDAAAAVQLVMASSGSQR